MVKEDDARGRTGLTRRQTPQRTAIVQEALAGRPVDLMLGGSVTELLFTQHRFRKAWELANELQGYKEVSAEVSDQADEFVGRAVRFVCASFLVAWAAAWAKIRHVL
jgi:hypothetical protein